MINLGLRIAIKLGIGVPVSYVTLVFTLFLSLSDVRILMVAKVIGFRWECDQIDITW